jgi:hypothetical protein
MLRLIGNIAQVKELRSRLMESQYIRKFSNLVFPIQDEIKVFIYIYIKTINTWETQNVILYIINRSVIMLYVLLHTWHQMVMKYGILKNHLEI